MTDFNTLDKGLPYGVRLARQAARMEARRNMQGMDDGLDKKLDDMLAELEAMGVEDDTPEAEASMPRHIDRVPPFLVDGAHEQVVEAHQQAREFVRCITGRACPPYTLSLLGGSGCGKTHLAKLVQASLWDAGVECQVWRWASVLTAVREDKGDMLRQIEGLRVLILDDVGAEFIGTDKALEFSFSKLCELLEVRQRRWTMLTSNKTMRQIADAEERCSSRLIRNGGRVVSMHSAPDWTLERRLAIN